MSREFTVGQPLWNWVGTLCRVTRVFKNTIRVDGSAYVIDKKTLCCAGHGCRGKFFLTEDEADDHWQLINEWQEFGRQLMTMEMPDISREQLAEVRKTFGMKETT